MPQNALFSKYSSEDPNRLLNSTCAGWAKADSVSVERLWDGSLLNEGSPDLASLQTEVRSLWTSDAIFFLFSCSFESLHVNADLGSGGPIDCLWEYDVAEVFLRPPGGDDYFEFEVSPLGQWIDVHILKPRVEVDFGWRSSFQVSSTITNNLWSAVLQVGFAAMSSFRMLGANPRVGDSWRVNLFRASGREPSRRYLAWRPTYTENPDFHVPAAFGCLIFVE